MTPPYDEPAPRVEIGAREEGEEVLCFVRDNGSGIDEAQKERIFGLFERLGPDERDALLAHEVAQSLGKPLIEWHVKSTTKAQHGLYEYECFLCRPELRETASEIAGALAAGAPIAQRFIKMGLASTFLGVVLVHLTFCLPYSVFVLWGVFSNYNPDYEGQARTLGASSWKVIVRVMLPLTFPGIMVAGLFSFLLSWSQYLSTLIIGGGRVTTLPVLLFALMGSGDRPVAAAVSIVFVAPAFLALLFSARYLGGRSIAGIR